MIVSDPKEEKMLKLKPYSSFADYYYRTLSDDFYNKWDRILDPHRGTKGWQQDEDAYKIAINIPGYGKEDVEISVKEDIITINVADKNSYQYRLPKEYDLAETTAVADKGVLTVSVPLKSEPESSEIKIKVH